MEHYTISKFLHAHNDANAGRNLDACFLNWHCCRCVAVAVAVAILVQQFAHTYTNVVRLFFSNTTKIKYVNFFTSEHRTNINEHENFLRCWNFLTWKPIQSEYSEKKTIYWNFLWNMWMRTLFLRRWYYSYANGFDNVIRVF